MCQQCTALRINGVLCHEHGCPDAWKSEVRECKECGAEFTPADNWQEFCTTHCYAMYNGLPCDCNDCDDFRAELELDEPIVHTYGYFN